LDTPLVTSAIFRTFLINKIAQLRDINTNSPSTEKYV